MARRADRPRPAAGRGRRRFEVDRVWLVRLAVLAVVALALLLVARVSMMAFGGSGKRLERFERAQGERPPASAPAAPP